MILFARPLGKFLQVVERPKSVLDDGAASYEDVRQEQQAKTTTKLCQLVKEGQDQERVPKRKNLARNIFIRLFRIRKGQGFGKSSG